MSPAEIIGLLLASFKQSPLAQAIIVFYLAILAFRQLVNLVTSPDEGWYARRMRKLRHLADSVQEETQTRGYLEGLVEGEAFRRANGLPRSVSPNQQRLALRLEANGDLTPTEVRYAAEFAKPATDDKVSIVLGREDKAGYWCSVVAIAGLGTLGSFYALLAAVGGFEATTAAVVLVEVIFGVGLALSQMRPIFVARRLRKKLAAARLLEDYPRHWSDPLRFADGLLTAFWNRLRGAERRGGQHTDR